MGNRSVRSIIIGKVRPYLGLFRWINPEIARKSQEMVDLEFSGYA
jgi:hypothetical protein